MGKTPTPHARRLVFLVWALVAVFYFYLSYDYIRVSSRDKDFAEYAQYVVQLAGQDYRPAKDIRALLLVKADELDLPIRGEQIVIAGGGPSLIVTVNYQIDIQIPVFERGIYTKEFQHRLSYQSRR